MLGNTADADHTGSGEEVARPPRPGSAPTLDLILNVIASDLLPWPRLKRWVVKGMESNEYVGSDIIMSPGVRVESSFLGDYSGYGVGSQVLNSHVGRDGRIGANAFLEDAHLGDNVVVAANAVVTTRVPDNSVVLGTNRIVPIDAWRSTGGRIVQRMAFDRAPGWYWGDLGRRTGGRRRLVRSVVSYALRTYLPQLLNPSARIQGTRDLRCPVDEEGPPPMVDRAAMIDPLCPDNVRLGAGVRLDQQTVLLAHSGVNIVQDVFETGPITIGRRAVIGRHSVVLPGVRVPAGVVVPPHSVATARGAFLVEENALVPFGSLVRSGG